MQRLIEWFGKTTHAAAQEPPAASPEDAGLPDPIERFRRYRRDGLPAQVPAPPVNLNLASEHQDLRSYLRALRAGRS